MRRVAAQAEIRVRLPKFRSTIQHYARQYSGGVPKDELNDEDRAALITTAEAIITECEALLKRVLTFTPKGAGKARKAGVIQDRVLPWSKAPMKLAQVLGVLRKTNRDLNSLHWKKEWIPAQADQDIVIGDERALRDSAQVIAKWSHGCLG
jgi:hypothetical protein